MKQNFIGTADIIIFAPHDMNFKNKAYKKDEVIANLPDANINITYNDVSSRITGGRRTTTLAQKTNLLVETINTFFENYNEDAVKLLSHSKQKEGIIFSTGIYTADSSGTVFLNNSDAMPATVLDEDGNSTPFVQTQGMVENLTPGDSYTIHAKESVMMSQMGHNGGEVFSISIKIKTRQPMYMYIGRAVLETLPDFDIGNDRSLASSFTFTVLDGEAYIWLKD